jgi:hypothetical protein
MANNYEVNNVLWVYLLWILDDFWNLKELIDLSLDVTFLLLRSLF